MHEGGGGIVGEEDHLRPRRRIGLGQDAQAVDQQDGRHACLGKGAVPQPRDLKALRGDQARHLVGARLQAGQLGQVAVEGDDAGHDGFGAGPGKVVTHVGDGKAGAQVGVALEPGGVDLPELQLGRGGGKPRGGRIAEQKIGLLEGSLLLVGREVGAENGGEAGRKLLAQQGAGGFVVGGINEQVHCWGKGRTSKGKPEKRQIVTLLSDCFLSATR